MKTLRPILFFIALCLTCGAIAEAPLALTLQARSSVGKTTAVKEQWMPSHTAIIVCDMWDLHHCRNAVVREGEMAPRMNELLEKARAAGVLIIHAPSGCMKAYEGTPARERAKSAPVAARLRIFARSSFSKRETYETSQPIAACCAPNFLMT